MSPTDGATGRAARVWFHHSTHDPATRTSPGVTVTFGKSPSSAVWARSSIRSRQPARSPTGSNNSSALNSFLSKTNSNPCVYVRRHSTVVYGCRQRGVGCGYSRRRGERAVRAPRWGARNRGTPRTQPRPISPHAPPTSQRLPRAGSDAQNRSHLGLARHPTMGEKHWPRVGRTRQFPWVRIPPSRPRGLRRISPNC